MLLFLWPDHFTPCIPHTFYPYTIYTRDRPWRPGPRDGHMIQEGEKGCAHRAPPPEVETVREWSHTHNQALWHKHLLPDALRFLLEKSALRSRHLQAFIEDFKLDPDAALPHLQMFLTAPARSLATAFDIEHFPADTKIVQVAAAISKSQYAVISGRQDEGTVRDTLWDQEGLFLKLLACDNLDLEVHTIMDDVPEVPTLFVDSAGLDEVLRVMSVSHVGTVGLVDDAGRVRSIVKYQDIFKAFVREMRQVYYSDDNRPDLAKSLESLHHDDGSDEFEFDDEVSMNIIQTCVESELVRALCAFVR